MPRLSAVALCLLLAMLPGRASAADEQPPAGGSSYAPRAPYIRGEESGEPYLDLEAYRNAYRLAEAADEPYEVLDPWSWQVLPVGLIYSPYLADTKSSRFAATFVNVEEDGWLFDATLGTQVGLLRYGSTSAFFPEGLQVDAEGSAQARLDMPGDLDVRSVDFRGGLPISFGVGPRRWKFGYYHISSHLGDEFLLKNPTYPRLNFVRDVLIFGYSRHHTPNLRSYVEIGWAFRSDISEPWEVQFGIDYAPAGPTGIHGAPFFALNGHLREEVDWGGMFTFQAGWAWRSDVNTSLLRAGMQYYNGKSSQYSFYNEHEHQIGLALWYDY
ncbi:MAG: DUF1207 domain-containing protein [Pirellulaceae bacterium]